MRGSTDHLLPLRFRGTRLVSNADIDAVAIPDNNPTGVERTLEISETGTVREIEVSIDITHTFVGDLHVSLGDRRSGIRRTSARRPYTMSSLSLVSCGSALLPGGCPRVRKCFRPRSPPPER